MEASVRVVGTRPWGNSHGGPATQRGPTVKKHRGGAPLGATSLARLVPALAREPSLRKLRLAALRSLNFEGAK